MQQSNFLSLWYKSWNNAKNQTILLLSDLKFNQLHTALLIIPLLDLSYYMFSLFMITHLNFMPATSLIILTKLKSYASPIVSLITLPVYPLYQFQL